MAALDAFFELHPDLLAAGLVLVWVSLWSTP
jgi:hypothetical protein